MSGTSQLDPRSCMISQLHPRPGKWLWWASYDGGEHMTLGPAETREIIIDMVVDDRIGEYQSDDGSWRIAAEICECQENHQDLAHWFDAQRFLDDAGERMDDNECGSDEDGERHPLDEISTEQQANLEMVVREAIRGWQRRHDLNLRSYWFKDVRNIERLDIPCPVEGDTPQPL